MDEEDEICRVCLNSATIPIFGDEDLSDEINYFGSIEVSTDDDLPQHICSTCRELLASAIVFRSVAQKSDLVLRKRTAEVGHVVKCIEHNELAGERYIIETAEYIKTNEKYLTECENTVIEETAIADCGTDDDHESEINSVYLEYADTVNGSEDDLATANDNDLASITTSSYDNTSISVSIETSTEEFQSLVDSMTKKTAYQKCEICNITFRTKEQASDHCSSHDSEEAVICKVCQNIIHKDLYNVHLKVHRELFNQRVEKKYTKVECTVCGKCVSKTYIKKHMTIHLEDVKSSSRYKICPVCDKHIYTTYLNDHIKLKHSKQKPEAIVKKLCPICDRSFKESAYDKHVATHAARKKTYICHICGNELQSASILATHKLIHEDVYKYRCEFCPYKGKHLALLKVHVRTHTKDYQYKCQICDGRFSTKSNLTAHEKTHLKAQFECEGCGRCYKSEHNLQTHINLVHKKFQAFECSICRKSFGTKCNMTMHMRKIHNIHEKNASYLIAQGSGDQDSENVY